MARAGKSEKSRLWRCRYFVTEHNPSCGGGCCHFLFSPPLISILLPAWKVAHARRSPSEGRKKASRWREAATNPLSWCLYHTYKWFPSEQAHRTGLFNLSAFLFSVQPVPLFWSKISRNESNIIKTQSRHGEKTFPEETKLGSSVVFGAL